MAKEYFEEKPENAGKFADGLVRTAKNMTGQVLDYSPNSITVLESIIDAMRRDGAPFHKMGDTIFCMGCYLGEVFVRNGHRKWAAKESSPMKDFSSSFLIKLSATAYCNPIDKVVKRIENGEEDSLTYFYKTWIAKADPATTKKSFWKRLFGA